MHNKPSVKLGEIFIRHVYSFAGIFSQPAFPPLVSGFPRRRKSAASSDFDNRRTMRRQRAARFREFAQPTAAREAKHPVVRSRSTLTPGITLRAPQIIRPARTRTIKKLSETLFATDATAFLHSPRQTIKLHRARRERLNSARFPTFSSEHVKDQQTI